MKLKCIKGTVSCNGVVAEKGDVFEVPDELADGIVKSGFAILVDCGTTVEESVNTVNDDTGELTGTGEQTREKDGKWEHKHTDCNYWHPMARVHETDE